MKVSDILEFLEQEKIPFVFTGDRESEIYGFSSLNRYKEGTFTWIKTRNNIPPGYDLSQIRLAFLSEEISGVFQNSIRSPQSKRAFFSVIEYFYDRKEVYPPIGSFTYISPNVKLGKNVRIGHNCTLDGDITVGDNTVIWNNVVMVNRIHVGKNCEIRSGAVIGHDGFAYTEDERHVKTMIKHFGGVTLGDNVLIHENVCISRGTIDDTIIEDGVKIDSLSHIAHNCHFHKNSAAAAPCRTNGSVSVGEGSFMAGALVRNQCSIGDNAFVGLGAVVVRNVPDHQMVAGVPARKMEKKHR